MTPESLRARMDRYLHGDWVNGGDVRGVAWEVRTRPFPQLHRVSVFVAWTEALREAVALDDVKWAGLKVDSVTLEQDGCILGVFVELSASGAVIFAEGWAQRCAWVNDPAQCSFAQGLLLLAGDDVPSAELKVSANGFTGVVDALGKSANVRLFVPHRVRAALNRKQIERLRSLGWKELPEGWEWPGGSP